MCNQLSLRERARPYKQFMRDLLPSADVTARLRSSVNGTVNAQRPAWMSHDGSPLTGAGISIAVIDSGWNRAIADSRVLPGASVMEDPVTGIEWSDDDSDRLMHGTRCAQLALHIAPDARIVPLRVFDADLETSPALIEAALDRAVGAGIRVINLSLGARREHAMHGLYRACEQARDASAIVVAATSTDGRMFPAAFDNVLSVGSGCFATPFQHTYVPDTLVECVASGRVRTGSGDVRSPQQAGAPSFAAPRIAGMVALLLERWPTLDLDGVRAKLDEFAYHAADQGTYNNVE